MYGKGRSTCFVFVDHSERFVVKSVSRAERKLFINKMLEKYVLRIFIENKSRLVRILGVYEFKDSRINLLLMENALPNHEQAYIFDIKGSSLDRSTLDTFSVISKGVILKDNDFKTSGMPCVLNPNSHEELLTIIQDDVEFLRDFGVMDYSMLIGIYDNYSTASSRYSVFSASNVFNIAIIDILQTYCLSKKAERSIKRMINNEEPSSVDPSSYLDRFIRFVCESVIIKSI